MGDSHLASKGRRKHKTESPKQRPKAARTSPGCIGIYLPGSVPTFPESDCPFLIVAWLKVRLSFDNQKLPGQTNELALWREG